jgi:hypothetical protein
MTGTITFRLPAWRIAAVHGLVFAAWLFGADAERTTNLVAAFLSRGVKVEFS